MNFRRYLEDAAVHDVMQFTSDSEWGVSAVSSRKMTPKAEFNCVRKWTDNYSVCV